MKTNTPLPPLGAGSIDGDALHAAVAKGVAPEAAIEKARVPVVSAADEAAPAKDTPPSPPAAT